MNSVTTSVLEAPATTRHLHEFLNSGLDEAASGDPQATWMFVLPAPLAAPEALLELNGVSQGMVWDPPHGPKFSGLGAAQRIQLDGAERFEQLQQRAEQVWQSLNVRCHGEALAIEPRFFGGLAFDVGAARQRPWQDFGDGCFTLPRYLYGRHDGHASLTLTVLGSEAASEQRDQWSDKFFALLDGLEQPYTPHRGPLGVAEMASTEVEDADWLGRVEAIRSAIAAGSFEKIVAARRSLMPLEQRLSPSQVLTRLSKDLKASTRFAFCRPQASFLGVTPERLVAKHGRQIKTEALAGSIESGGEHAAALLDSGKDRHEQQLVVDAIVRRLEPLCDRLQVAARPTVRELRDVLHLATPIIGTLADDRHILDLVRELHPTPAVGGVPTNEAMAWIASQETDERGWYAAPIGWFDRHGDGEFAVALRSCVLCEDGAYLFVGAGIVADSDPQLELAETELKKQALRSALLG